MTELRVALTAWTLAGIVYRQNPTFATRRAMIDTEKAYRLAEGRQKWADAQHAYKCTRTISTADFLAARASFYALVLVVA